LLRIVAVLRAADMFVPISIVDHFDVPSHT